MSRFSLEQSGISYIRSGPQDSKVALVCVHGWACQATDYTYLFTELNKTVPLKFQAVAVDLPGHGKSSTKSYPVASISAFAEAVNAVANELGFLEIVLVGHSMGMRVVLEAWQQTLATTATSIVKGVIFLDGSHYKFRKSLFAFDKADPRSKNLNAEEVKEKIAEAFSQMFSSRTPPEFQASTLAHAKSIDAEYNESMRQSHISYDYERLDDVLAEMGKASIPLLNLQATHIDEQNQRIPLKQGEVTQWMRFLQEKVPQAQQFVIPGSSHFLHVDDPAGVARRIMEFVDGLDERF
ncbi:hypothetical protein LTR37_014783 [Vermiconidia calcicola]|uniref:Uncharacterized protein n=1 Tax=Vermiconidia calcicola TaxID=1690605 RepID=A0ACC3MSN3_9PEZI|nr:hypothetical protein LTR37_014783 [Vermiconidia calcicola]